MRGSMHWFLQWFLHLKPPNLHFLVGNLQQYIYCPYVMWQLWRGSKENHSRPCSSWGYAFQTLGPSNPRGSTISESQQNTKKRRGDLGGIYINMSKHVQVTFSSPPLCFAKKSFQEVGGGGGRKCNLEPSRFYISYFFWREGKKNEI